MKVWAQIFEISLKKQTNKKLNHWNLEGVYTFYISKYRNRCCLFPTEISQSEPNLFFPCQNKTSEISIDMSIISWLIQVFIVRYKDAYSKISIYIIEKQITRSSEVQSVFRNPSCGT